MQWTPAHFIAHGDALVRAAPVRTLSVLGGLRGDGAVVRCFVRHWIWP